jgi:hypothetical protein
MRYPRIDGTYKTSYGISFRQSRFEKFASNFSRAYYGKLYPELMNMVFHQSSRPNRNPFFDLMNNLIKPIDRVLFRAPIAAAISAVYLPLGLPIALSNKLVKVLYGRNGHGFLRNMTGLTLATSLYGLYGFGGLQLANHFNSLQAANSEAQKVAIERIENGQLTYVDHIFSCFSQAPCNLGTLGVRVEVDPDRGVRSLTQLRNDNDVPYCSYAVFPNDEQSKLDLLTSLNQNFQSALAQYSLISNFKEFTPEDFNVEKIQQIAGELAEQYFEKSVDPEYAKQNNLTHENFKQFFLEALLNGLAPTTTIFREIELPNGIETQPSAKLTVVATCLDRVPQDYVLQGATGQQVISQLPSRNTMAVINHNGFHSSIVNKPD